MKRLRGKLTYSNVMVTVLAFVVLAGGTAYAASEMLPKNSVGSKQIQKEAVTPAKLSKASKATLTGPSGATGATGQEGKEGSRGPQGVPGPTASAFSQDNAGFSLEAFANEVNQATITTTTQSRIFAQASIDLNASAAANLFCYVSEEASGFTHTSGDWTIRANTAATGDAHMDLLGSKVLPPGTYTLRVVCGLNSGTATYVESDFGLIAAAA